MTNHSAPSADTARQTLSTTQQLTRRVRHAQRGTWFPLVLLGLVVVASAPFYRLGRYVVTCDPALGARGGVQIIDRGACVQVVGWPVGVYWILAFVLAYVAIAAFYVYRARSRGVGARVLPYVARGSPSGWSSASPRRGPSNSTCWATFRPVRSLSAWSRWSPSAWH